VVLVAKEAAVPCCDSSPLAAMDLSGVVVMAAKEVGVAGCDSSLLVAIDIKITIFLDKGGCRGGGGGGRWHSPSNNGWGEGGSVTKGLAPPKKHTHSIDSSYQRMGKFE
jgi:hypothetical protein